MMKHINIYVILLVIFLFAGCSKAKEPIKIGFIGDISTKNSQLAIDARNAVEYYINKINEDGGIKNHHVELIVKDDQANLEVALKMHEEFKEENVLFVLGHMNSNMVEAMMKSSGDDLLFFSPTISTTVLTGIDDYIFRSPSADDRQAELFFEYASNQKIQDLVIVYDLMNKVYTETVAERIIDLYETSDLTVAGVVEYDTRIDQLSDVVKKIKALEYKNILIIAQATDSAYFMQEIKKEKPDVSTYSVSWSMTDDFIQNGGKAVNGTVFIGLYKPESETIEFTEFVKAFEKKYAYEPSFVSVLAYDAIYSLIEGIEKADTITPTSVKEALIDIGMFEGLQETFYLDEFGDSNRQYMMYELVDTEFVPMRDWN